MKPLFKFENKQYYICHVRCFKIKVWCLNFKVKTKKKTNIGNNEVLLSMKGLVSKETIVILGRRRVETERFGSLIWVDSQDSLPP